MPTVLVWCFVSPSKKLTFFREQFDDDSHASSPFAASQGETFIDHDWLETLTVEPEHDVDRTIGFLSYARSFADKARAAAATRDCRDATHVIAFYEKEGELRAPTDHVDGDTHLMFLGRFPYEMG